MFERFGKLGFTRHTRVQAFVEHLERGEITASRCRRCGRRSLPPRADCPACGDGAFELVPVDPRGSVLCATMIHALPAGFEDGGPFGLALVDLVEGGRLLAPLGESFGDELPPAGEPVRLVVRRSGEGEQPRVFFTAERGGDGGRRPQEIGR